MGEGTDRPVGERRRRREAERAAARAAEAAGASRPLTRRELRWQQAEEAARLEAIATGELRLPVGSAGPEAPLHEPGAEPDARVPDPSAGTAPSAPSAGSTQPGPVSSAPSAGSAQPNPVSSAPSAGTAPSAPSAGSSPARLTSSSSAPSASSPAGPDTGAFRVPSRRSLRERAPQDDMASPESPQERTATGRRPVVRTPSTARGVRSLDSTGQLTGIQPVVRPDSGPQDAPVWSERATFSLDAPARAAREALPEPPEADSADDDEDDFPSRPQWVALGEATAASGEETSSAVPSRRSLRGQASGEDHDEDEPVEADEGQPPHPALTLVKVAVLVIVAVVLGALIWLLATEAFDDDTSAAATHQTSVTTHQTSVTTPHLEETSAR